MPATKYEAADGKRIPSVTTVIKLLSIGGYQGLLYWANQMGLAGKTLEEAQLLTADVGSFAHHWMEADIRGLPYDPEAVGMSEKQLALVAAAHEQWDRWCRHTRIRFRHTEVEMVSERHRYGGTTDFVGEIDDKDRRVIVLGDLKTGGVYPEAVIQVAAYGQLWEETTGQRIDEYVIIRSGKEDASFSMRSWSADSETIKIAWGLFVTALEIRPLAKQLEKAVRR